MRAIFDKRLFLAFSILLGPCAGTAATADELGEPVSLREVRGGSLLFRTGRQGVFRPAPTLETDAALRVHGLVVRARVGQRFHNPTDEWLEAVYAFPLPEDAAVDHLRMVIGERVIEGEIRERSEAKKVYEEAKREGKKASLLEQERPNVFTTSVANIGPGEEIVVVIEYQQTLRYEQGGFSLRFPMVIAPRYVPGRCLAGGAATTAAPAGGEPPPEPHLTPAVAAGGAPQLFAGTGWAFATDQVPDAARITPHVVASGGPKVYLQVELDPGLPVTSITSPSHELDVEKRTGAVPSYLVELQDLQVAADRDFVLEWRAAPGSVPQAAVFSDELDGAGYRLLMVVPPHGEEAAAARLARETIFIIDTSGSMRGASIRQARQALLVALDRLQPEDHFNVVRFSDTAERLFPASVPADDLHRERAAKYVDGLSADGGTEMLAALRLALDEQDDEHGVRQVIFITDGAVGNEAALFAYIHQHLGASRLFPVGIGSAPNSHFLRNAADFGRGTFTHVGRVDDVGRRMGELFAKLESPVLHDVEVFWDDPEAETWPERVPDLYLGEPVVVAARLPSVPAAGARVRVSGWRGSEYWERSFTVAVGARESGIDKLWARRKIAALMDGLALGVDAEAVRAQVLEVALAHHLVSKYTSLVAVEKVPSAPAGVTPQTRPVPVHLPAGWSPSHVTVLPSGATPARLHLLAGLLALFAAWVLARPRPFADRRSR